MQQDNEEPVASGNKKQPGQVSPSVSIGRTTAERAAITGWARQNYPHLVRSKNATVLWGRGRKWHQFGTTFLEKYCIILGLRSSGWLNAGVRIKSGQVIVENYRGREVDRVPLAAIAVQVVALLGLPGWDEWAVTDGVGLLAYADWLDEQGESRWASRIRLWGVEAMKNVGVTEQGGAPDSANTIVAAPLVTTQVEREHRSSGCTGLHYRHWSGDFGPGITDQFAESGE